MGKTTNWTKENEFHPAAIISVFTGWALPPHNAIGLTELVTFMIDGRRDSHANDEGRIFGFYMNVAPRMVSCTPYLKMQFPEIAEYAAQLSKEDIEDFLSTEQKTENWVSWVENEFGKSTQVCKIEYGLPMQQIQDKQQAFLDSRKTLILSQKSHGNGYHVTLNNPRDEEELAPLIQMFRAKL